MAATSDGTSSYPNKPGRDGRKERGGKVRVPVVNMARRRRTPPWPRNPRGFIASTSGSSLLEFPRWRHVRDDGLGRLVECPRQQSAQPAEGRTSASFGHSTSASGVVVLSHERNPVARSGHAYLGHPAICVRDSGRFVLSAQAACGCCPRTVSPVRATGRRIFCR